MEKLITGPLAAALANNRERFNRLFAQSAQKSSILDPADFTRLLRDTLQKVVDPVEKLFPERAEMAAAQLYEICLTLYSQGYLGPQSRNPLVPALWQHILPAVPLLLARAPRRIAGELSNAAINIGQQEPSIGISWLKRLHSLSASFTTPEQLLDTALVLAWRSGMPQYRETAMAIWQKLPDNLKAAALGLQTDDPSGILPLLEKGMANPWHPPHLIGKDTEVRLTVVGRAGRFKGFAGQFGGPPLVASNGETIVAYDAEGTWSLWADFFGIALRRTEQATDSSYGAGFSGFSIDSSGTVSFGTNRISVPPLAGSSSHAATGTTLAVTLPYSHCIYIVAPLVSEKRQ